MTEKKISKLEQDVEWLQATKRLLQEMPRHIGRARAIGAGPLFEKVFLRPYKGNKINGTRLLRKLIEEVKYGADPTLICCSCAPSNPGYYYPSSDSERRDYFAREEKEVKKKIGRLARLNRMTEAAYMGQLGMEI